MSLCSDTIKCEFSHDNDKELPVWHQYEVVSWREHNNMRDAFKRTCEITNATWAKCTHFRKQGT